MKGLYAVFFILSLVSIIIFPLSLQFVFAQKKNEANTFPVIANIGLETIEKKGFIRVVAFISGQAFTEDIQLSEIKSSTKKIAVTFNVEKETNLVTAGPPDELFICAYHVKDILKEYNSFIYYDCNEGDLLSTDSPTKLGLFKNFNVYDKSKVLYDLSQKSIPDPKHKNSDKVLIKVIVPLSDRKDTEKLMVMAMVKGQIQTAMMDVQQELDKSKDYTLTKVFTFDRNTDIGAINIGDKFFACVSSEDLTPPEATECEKREVKRFGTPSNPLPAR